MAPQPAPLPPHLSDQQRYALATCGLRDGPTDYRTVRKGAAREYDDDGNLGNWITRPPTDETWLISTTSQHHSSFARALARLEDRGLIERQYDRRRNNIDHVLLTTKGKAAADELLRRHNDGRYDLQFRTLNDADD